MNASLTKELICESTRRDAFQIHSNSVSTKSPGGGRSGRKLLQSTRRDAFQICPRIERLLNECIEV